MASDITSAWLAIPADSASVGDGNDHLKDIKDSFYARLRREHNFNVADATPQGSHGVHLPGSAVTYFQEEEPTLRPDGATLLNADDTGRLWIKESSLIVYMWLWDESGSTGSWEETSATHGMALLTSGTAWTALHTGPVKVTCIGGGGGGRQDGTLIRGAGAGALCSAVLNVVRGTAYALAIGNAGATAGANGGTTTFTDGITTLSAGGGYGASVSSRGAGGVASGGTLNLVGASGEMCHSVSVEGRGGSTLYGNGAMAAYSPSSYAVADGYGSGGAGNGLAVAGRPGCIIIEW